MYGRAKKIKKYEPNVCRSDCCKKLLDWMIDLPWFKKSEVDIDLKKALCSSRCRSLWFRKSKRKNY